VSILGSTGSVGVSTLDVLDHARRNGEEIEIVALTGGANVARLAEQALHWRPRLAVIANADLHDDLRQRLAGSGIETAAGEGAVVAAAEEPADWVMAAIVGVAGLKPTLAAARTGAVIALANKESIVCAGPLLLAVAKAFGGSVIPVDSEHSAIFQVFDAERPSRVRRLILTASGGPFRTRSLEEMGAATPAQALAHPNWDMGPKISIDSATMFNKGLEMIEAAYLFGMSEDKVDVVIHPQSIVHSLVEYEDGSTLAQLGAPDMRTPIACAWSWPDRLHWPAPRLELGEIGTLTFETPDTERFPALKLARDALRLGGGAPAALNAANEVAVAAFLNLRIGFLEIASIVAQTLEVMEKSGDLLSNRGDLEEAFAVHERAHRAAHAILDGSPRRSISGRKGL
jgi:1-deoxy-D-xylulose-5-phosphate reductoisomerase